MTKVYNYEAVNGGVTFTSFVKRTMESIQRVGAAALLDSEEEVPDEKVDLEGRYFPPLPPAEPD